MSKHRSRKHKKIINKIKERQNKITEVFISDYFQGINNQQTSNIENEKNKNLGKSRLNNNRLEEYGESNLGIKEHHRAIEDVKENIKTDVKGNIKDDTKEDIKDDTEEDIKESKKEDTKKDAKGCEPYLLNYKTVTLCKNEPIKLTDSSKSLLVKLPVVVSKFILNVNCDVEIKFKDPVFKIKNSQENVYLTYCNLIPKAHRLFFNGYVRKSIEYLTVKSKRKMGKETITSQLTVYIPFEGVTEISYSTPPVLDNLEGKKEITCYCNDDRLGIEQDETTYKYEECLNEKIFCELIKVNIFESDVIEDRKYIEEECFNKMNEKLVLYLTLRLIQNQEVSIS